MNTIVTLVVLVASCYQTLSEPIRYDDFKVYRLTPKTQEAVEALHMLEDSNTYDFWTDIRGVGRTVDIMVPPHLKYRFNDTITSGAFDAEVYISDVQKLIDNETPKTKSIPNALEWTYYHSLEEINTWLQSLASERREVTLLTVGRSYEGRDILGIKISFNPANENKAVFIEGNIHAREWISSAVATWITNEVLNSQNPTVRRIVERHDWYIVPVFNPDGFVYTKNSDRLWRKTRVPYSGCAGADPNRNWDFHFNEGGTSNSPCSETYRGPGAFSEPSTRSISRFLTSIGPKLQSYIAFHSYSQYLLLPYGFSSTHYDNYNDLYAIGVKAIQSLAQRYGTRYEVGNIVELLYVASGGSMDWVKGTFRTPVTYTYELRDTGRYGFVLPPEQIIPSALETWDSVLTIIDEFDKIL